MKSAPAITLVIIFQLPIPVYMRSAAPRSMAIVDVSPTEPGIVPRNISIKEGISPPSCALASGVAPEKPSTKLSPLRNPAIHTLSPDM